MPMPEPSFHECLTISPLKKSQIVRYLTEHPEEFRRGESEALLKYWPFWARESQLPPAGDWQFWMIMAGRGAGKTRSGSEWIRQKVKDGYSRLALVAPTAADCRDVIVEGDSGILATSWSKDRDHKGNLIGRPLYEASKRRLTWENGATATHFSAEEPDRLRGPQHEALWFDELAAYDSPQEVWDMAMFGLRLGDNPQAMITTTPRPIPIIRALLKDPLCVVTRESTFANRANLAPSFISTIVARYEGTRLGRQELLGEVIDSSDGALWSRDFIKLRGAADLQRVIVAVDPAVTDKAQSALTGIVVVGLGVDGCGYVLADLSGRFTPDGWANVVARAYHDWRADRVVAEGNQGGDMVRFTLHTANPGLPISIVHASRGKFARAEPVAALYEQGKVFHTQAFAELEDQMCTWEPLGKLPSPDRLDALVWGLTELMIAHGPPARFVGDVDSHTNAPLAVTQIEYW